MKTAIQKKSGGERKRPKGSEANIERENGIAERGHDQLPLLVSEMT